ncbi:right-handed parallel beta-helix repeat-containing protein [Propioniciclava flava]|uniref:Uncharacterized protein n=1 Tax=Propioniciclava flava TaxID=2072026 RepID=A0A4Q2EG86_9ACTN|nr:right-handed parallel beta-helix repeat-containing protein [Propioniciclava flava]RXW31334.1 hypothetical protein C1706_12735 [Propioniciclava flava]
MTVFHVAITGSDLSDGSEAQPWRTINHAAQRATAGDTVLVHAGVYREWVKPLNSGLSDARRITYAAAEGEQVVVKGSEQITDWTREEGSVWRTSIPNAVFGDWNPYALELVGDWVVRPVAPAPRTHLGDVYLNGRSFYEVTDKAGLAAPERRDTIVDDRTGQIVAIEDPDATRYVWYAEVGEHETTIWANFHEADPTAELVEINVRRSVFYPTRNHVDYITVRGFELAHAATPWAPPTADQPGLIGPNWAKGWIIEGNHIHDAKCSAISLGKEATTGDNYFTHRLDKPGYQYQLEAVFTARQHGWAKERIGSHVVRNNVIHDCGQNGIVGHLGCVFSRIHDNEIYRVATKREFYGHEIGGIKLHAAIDVEIAHNHIHGCALGVWSDWQTQGTRITRNVFHDNSRDLYVEVSHGPYVVDHNVFGSKAAIETMSDGGAYVGNLVAGTLLLHPVMERPTPYHVPHSTEVAGYASIYGGDDRWIGNIFVGNGAGADTQDAYGDDAWATTLITYGTGVYDGHPASFEEYLDAVHAAMPGDVDIFFSLKNPVYLRDNVYLNGAQPYERESNALVDAASADLAITESDGAVTVTITLPDGFAEHRFPVVTTAALGRVRMVDADFENPDGSPLVLDVDLSGVERAGDSVAGPLFDLTSGTNTVTVWSGPEA